MSKQEKLEPHIATLALACAISPLAMNVYLPSLPDITRYFDASAATGQLTLSLFLGTTAFMQLVCGPLSDRYGRRPVMLAFIGFMLLATLVCIFAPTMEMFLIGRMLQASAAAGMVLSRAIVRDTVSGDEAASRIGYVTMGMTLAPMLGPMIGGFLQDSFGWQASFWLLFGVTAIALVILYLDLNETNTSLGGGFRDQINAWPEIFRSHRFWGYAATCAFSSGSFFAFLGGAPALGSEYYGLTASKFGLYFFFVAIGYMSGNYIAGRFSIHFGLNRMMLMGNIFVLAGLSGAILLTSTFPQWGIAFFMPMFFLGFGNGVTLPNANAGIVSVRPKIAGAASSLGAFLQIGGGALISALVGFFLVPADGPFILILMIMGPILLAIVSTAYVIHIDRLRSHQNRSASS